MHLKTKRNQTVESNLETIHKNLFNLFKNYDLMKLNVNVGKVKKWLINFKIKRKTK